MGQKCFISELWSFKILNFDLGHPVYLIQILHNFRFFKVSENTTTLMYTQVAAIVTIMKLGKVATCENVVYD